MASADNSIIEMTPMLMLTNGNVEHKTQIDELEESLSQTFDVLKQDSETGCCLNFWNLPFKLKKFIVTDIGMTTADVLTDLVQAINHFLNRDKIWGSLTLLFTFLPMIYQIILTTIKCEWGKNQEDKYQIKTTMGYWEKKFIAIRNEWKKPIQHFPLAQTLVHCGFFFQKQYIREDIKALERKYQDLTRGTIADFKGNKDNEKAEAMEKIKALVNEYKKAKDYQNEVDGDLHHFKIMEAFLEGAPQTILQLTIVFQEERIGELNHESWKTLFLSMWSWISIIISFLTFSLGAAGIFTEGPTQVFKHKNASWKDTLLIFIPMLTMTLARILTWSVTFAYLKYWGFVIMLVVALVTTLPIFVQWKTYGSSQALLGAVVAMFGPCMVINDFGRIFLSTGILA